MNNQEKFPTHEVEISSFTKKGHGLGHTTDEKKRKVEVPFSIPGDTVLAMLGGKRHGTFNSKLKEVVKPSPERITPRCIHFASCGGCRWQQMSLETQLNLKQETIENLFRPLLPPDFKINPILSSDPWQYRNKMEFSFSSDSSGKEYLGLIIDGSRGKVLNLSECHLVNPWFIDTLNATRSWWKESGIAAYHPHTNTGSLRTLTVREGKRTGDRLVMLTVSGNPDYAIHKSKLESFVAFLRDAIEPIQGKLSIFLRIHQAVKGQETTFYEMVLHGEDHINEILSIQPSPHMEPKSLNFTISPSAFFQPNTTQAEKLYSLALQMLEIPQNSVVYDLYCGTGTLGICAAPYAKHVVGIEITPESVLDARTNATENGLKNTTFLNGSVRDVMHKIMTEKSHPLPDVVMLDPPRVGLDTDTLNYLVEIQPKKILYISCNPTTQAPNIAFLMQHGYHIKAIQPVDQFPHTIHIENIVTLEK